MHYNLLYSFCLFYVKLCLKMAYLKRPIRLKPGDEVDQDDFNKVVFNSSKNLVSSAFFINNIDDHWRVSDSRLVNIVIFYLELSIWEPRCQFFVWKSSILCSCCDCNG